MKSKILLVPYFLLLSLAGCVGAHSTVRDRLNDQWLETVTTGVAKNMPLCLRLARKSSFKSGDVTYTFPKGMYVGNRHNAEGAFYLAPAAIKTSNLFVLNQHGVFLSYNGKSASTYRDDGPFGRPVRSVKLPLSLIRKFAKVSCH